MPSKTAPKAAGKAAPKTARQTTKSEAVAVDVRADAVVPVVPDPGPAVPTLKLRDLIARVVEAKGGNKKGVKDIVEATLEQLGAALAKGEDLNLPGLGKGRVARTTEKDGRTMMVLKLRSLGAAKTKDPLAAPGEDD